MSPLERVTNDKFLALSSSNTFVPSWNGSRIVLREVVPSRPLLITTVTTTPTTLLVVSKSQRRLETKHRRHDSHCWIQRNRWCQLIISVVDRRQGCPLFHFWQIHAVWSHRKSLSCLIGHISKTKPEVLWHLNRSIDTK